MLVKIAPIGKMPYHKLPSGKDSLGNLLGKPQLCRSSREKKAAPDAQGRLQCCKWREF